MIMSDSSEVVMANVIVLKSFRRVEAYAFFAENFNANTAVPSCVSHLALSFVCFPLV